MQHLIPTTIKKISKDLERQSKLTLLLLSLQVTLLIGLIDYLTGVEISLSFFYLFPVSISAWGIGRQVGILLSLFSVFTWRISNQLAGEHFSHWLIPYWNTLIRLGVFVVVTILLAQLRSVLEKERALARTDSLTGALNRRAFFERVEAEILRSRRYQRPFTIAYIDLDGFKSINDQFGHSTGDALLVSVVQVIDENLRRGDLFARLGGDEFAILLLETDQVLAPIVVSRLQKAILNQMQQNQWSVTLSIGVLTYLKPPHSVDEMIRSADRLMYTVKSTSKNAIKYSAYMG